MSASPLLPPSAESPRPPHAAGWLIGAFVLALAVQAIFLLMPEPKSAGATDSTAAEAAAPLDSTAFTLEEDQTVLLTEMGAATDSTENDSDSLDSNLDSNSAPLMKSESEPESAPKSEPKMEMEEPLPPVKVDTAPVNALPTLPDTAPGE